MHGKHKVFDVAKVASKPTDLYVGAWVYAVRFAPDGSVLAAGGYTMQVILFDFWAFAYGSRSSHGRKCSRARDFTRAPLYLHLTSSLVHEASFDTESAMTDEYL